MILAKISVPVHSQTWPPLLLLLVPVQVPSVDIQTYCIPPPESGTPGIKPQFQLNNESPKIRQTDRQTNTHTTHTHGLRFSSVPSCNEENTN